ncbi:ionotropic receptor 93a-like [Dermacentor albipictus]|uniref:ionotropic receptor 93a-like n=1 Tax=Dermacentor albipictus TaxID=60249 RepID=UPI0038FCEE40
MHLDAFLQMPPRNTSTLRSTETRLTGESQTNDQCFICSRIGHFACHCRSSQSSSSSWTAGSWTRPGASPETPGDTPVRVLVGVWWIAVVVLMNAFAGQMRACLLVKSDVPKINTVQEVADRAAISGLVPYGLANTESSWLIQPSSRPDYQKLFAMMKRHGSLIDRLYTFSDQMLMEVSTGKAIIIHVETLLRIAVSAFCKNKQVGEFYFAEETLNTWRFAIYMSDKLPQPLKRRINQFVARYEESGITPHHLKYALPSIDHCAVREEDEVLRFSDTFSIFWMWGIWCLLALSVFALELLVACCTRHPQRCR